MTKSEAEIMGIYGTLLLNLGALNEDNIESGQCASYDRLKKALAWLVVNNPVYRNFVDLDNLLHTLSSFT